MTGYPWAAGDLLLAADLNAAFANSASGGAGNGITIGNNHPNYMILSGGAAGAPATITTAGPWADLSIVPALNGKLQFNLWRNYPAPSGANELCRFDYNAQGTNSGQNYSAEIHAINNDTVTGGFSYFNFLGGPGAGATGGRTAFGVNFQPGGPTTVGASNFYVGSAVFCTTAYNGGGTSGATQGGFFASNDMALLGTGATWWEELCGYELDVGVATGASCSYKHGMKVNLWSTDAVAGGGGKDSAYSTSAMNATSVPTSGWDFGFAFGDGYGYWPMKTTSTMIGVATGPGGGPARTCAWGIDFNAVTFSGGLIRGPGFSVNGSGNVVAALVALNTTAGPTIRAGTGAATGTQPSGSLWLRTDGTAGARLYVSAGAGTWTAVATV